MVPLCPFVSIREKKEINSTVIIEFKRKWRSQVIEEIASFGDVTFDVSKTGNGFTRQLMHRLVHV